MPRKARIDAPGALQHIICRGIERRKIFDNEDVRTIGAEHVVLETIKELDIDRKLRRLGLNRLQVSVALGVIAGRMIAPGSERATH